MNFQQFAVATTRKGLAQFEKSAQATAPDKAHWQPMGEGRSIVDIIVEVDQATRMFTAVLKDRAPKDFSEYFTDRSNLGDVTIDQALGRLNASTEELCAALMDIKDDELQISIELTPDWKPTLEELVMLNSFHVAYHMGQINYIQTLYGDKVDH